MAYYLADMWMQGKAEVVRELPPKYEVKVLPNPEIYAPDVTDAAIFGYWMTNFPAEQSRN